jgi:hypothetical protein
MPAKTTAFPCLSSILLILIGVLAFPAGSQAQTGCSSNIHGDHITAANDFQVSGISCGVALIFATNYTDSADQINTALPGTEHFIGEAYEYRYRWTCRTTQLPHPHMIEGIAYGTQYHCTGQSLKHQFGPASMSFKWWLTNERRCTPYLFVSRNQTCSYAHEWTQTATELISRFVSPFRTSTNGVGLKTNYYDYYFSGNPQLTDNNPTGPSGFLYECSETEALEEEGDLWDCWEPGRPPASTQYAWGTEAK